jgi:hypothetical protein
MIPTEHNIAMRATNSGAMRTKTGIDNKAPITAPQI